MVKIKFGTDGWRALMCDEFTLGPVRRVVQAIADYVRRHGGEERGLVVGYDARFFSDRFAEEASRVLLANGIRVFTLPRDLPTPVVAFAVKHRGAFGAIMFTASHNPPEYNGIKFIPAYAGPATPEITGEIEALLAAQNGEIPPPGKPEGSHLLVSYDPVPAYLAHLAGLVDREAIARSGLRLVVDPMFGSGRGLLDRFLGEDGRVETIHDRRDPLFGGMMPDPQEANLAELRARVTAVPNSLGLATDGDADRFGIVDADGTYLTPNQVIALLLFHLVRGRGWKGVAVRTVATTHLIDRIAAAWGLSTVETPVGFKYIGEIMRTRPVVIGGEESGGLSIRGHIPEKDGLLACALAAEMRAMSGRPLVATLAELYREYGGAYTRRLDLHLDQEEKERLMRSFLDDPPTRVLGQEVVEVRRIDGVKCLLASGAWFLLRPSGTESLVRVYVEAPELDERNRLVTWLEEVIAAERNKVAS
ncbi:MAG: phosphoglucomutase/phosphomannomutase family protein [Firmicutes bacterium]|nr:phosphoglucomutase/phosphomannomutase family protein [Bacillota bacterium]